MPNTHVYLNFPLDALKVVQEVAHKPCEIRFWHVETNRVQPCTKVNQCLPCRALNAMGDISVITNHIEPDKRGR